MRIIRGIIPLLILCAAGCASRPDGPPTAAAQSDICRIFDERPHWQDDAQAASLRWGVPMELVMAIIWKESNFRPEARPPRTYALGVVPTGRVSSAYGYAQAIDGTWDWYRDETGNSGADRDDFDDATDFVGWYVDKTRKVNGLSTSDAYGHYLAYHEGHTGYRRGNWRKKTWLLEAAQKVSVQTARYGGQLRGCA